MPVRRFLFAVLGLLAVLLLAAIIWAPLLTRIPGLKLEELGDETRLRFLGAGALVAVLILRFLVQPPRKPSRKSVVWGEFATSTGGNVSEELRRFGSVGWSGGTTVHWDIRGVEVTLSTTSDSDRNDDTRFLADLSLRQPFQFHVVQESMLTKVLFSPQLWSVALRAVKEHEGKGPAPTTGRGVAERLSFLAEKEILIGDPRLDQLFIIKSDAPGTAREFFADAGVSGCLLEMSRVSKSWQLSLMARGTADQYQMTLTMPGVLLDPQGLDASRKLMEASIRRLSDRGVLATRNAA